jgi:hypothetical protein
VTSSLRHFCAGVREFKAKHALLEMAGVAMQALGPRSFFEVVPLDLQMDGYGACRRFGAKCTPITHFLHPFSRPN